MHVTMHNMKDSNVGIQLKLKQEKGEEEMGEGL
jgi:hypothetical protein